MAESEATAAVETAAPQGTEQPPERTFTQKDVDKFAGTARKEAKSNAYSELLGSLGFESVDAAKEFVNEYRYIQDATKSDLDRLTEERDQLKNEREKYVAGVNQRVVNSELRSGLAAAGINPERVALAQKVADLSGVEVDESGNVSGMDDVVSSLRESSPEWFEASGPPPSIGRGTNPGPQEVQSGDPKAQMGQFLGSLLTRR